MTLLNRFRLFRAMTFALVPSLAVMGLQLVFRFPADPSWWLLWLLVGQLAWLLFSLALCGEYFIFQGPFGGLGFGLALLVRTIAYTLVLLLFRGLAEVLLAVLGFPRVLPLGPSDMAAFVGFALVLTAAWTFVAMVGASLGRGVLPALLRGQYHKSRSGIAGVMALEPALADPARSALQDTGWLEFLGDYLALVQGAAQASGARISRIHEQGAILEWSEKEMIQHGPLVFIRELKILLSRNAGRFAGRYGAEPGIRAGVHLGEISRYELSAGKRLILQSGPALRMATRLLEAAKKTGDEMLVSQSCSALYPEPESGSWKRVGHIPSHGQDPELVVMALVRV